MAGLLGDIAIAPCAEAVAPVDFSIAAQPLTMAISLCGDKTGSEALYDASLVSGRYSGPMHGLMTLAEGGSPGCSDRVADACTG